MTQDRTYLIGGSGVELSTTLTLKPWNYSILSIWIKLSAKRANVNVMQTVQELWAKKVKHQR